MEFDPTYEFYYEMEETGFGLFLGFYLIYFVVMMAISVGTYILQSLGMYTIAKRRGIKSPWLAWIPIGSAWILGSISDQYRYVVKGQVKNKRKAMLTLMIVVMVLLIAFYAIFGAFMVQAIAYDDTVFATDHTAEMNMLGTALGMLVVALVMFGFAVALAVLQYMALYDLYRSADRTDGVVYLVLSILISIIQPVFIFLCRNKDGGMPPRIDGR